jgi:hypothetical protein
MAGVPGEWNSVSIDLKLACYDGVGSEERGVELSLSKIRMGLSGGVQLKV